MGLGRAATQDVRPGRVRLLARWVLPAGTGALHAQGHERLAGGLHGATANGQPTLARMGIAHPLAVVLQVGDGLVDGEGFSHVLLLLATCVQLVCLRHTPVAQRLECLLLHGHAHPVQAHAHAGILNSSDAQEQRGCRLEVSIDAWQRIP